MNPLGELDMRGLYTTGAVVHMGGRHLGSARNGQDHAVAIGHEKALIVAVADGVSRVHGAPSHTEVGSILSAEIAARAAADAALRGLGPTDLRAHVAAALLQQLTPLHVALGDSAPSLLHCTLVLGVTTPTFTAIWLVGDGAWGAIGSLAHGRGSPRADCAPACYGGQWECHGGRHERTLGQTVFLLTRAGDVDAFARGLECVLETEGPALGLYVATDGLADEPVARELLRGPLRDGDTLRHALVRAPHSDDLAVAWATKRSAELDAKQFGLRPWGALRNGDSQRSHQPPPLATAARVPAGGAP